ncbi:uncharacterized protein LOC114364700 [Ostrinia furnacalis]|uniref:uncharacterized protein LOC114364700 n=1 Tax=Ostrinia furnacalis TaxID=93504 RepID=UPI00103FD137|nr:uncharacterized protein LOC114364700 [Ostrinia furnacalis]
MDPEFVKAESTNLLKIDTLMVTKLFALNPDFCSAKLRNVKLIKSAGESNGDDAIGYVQLKRNRFNLKCKMCPEHKVHSKQYQFQQSLMKKKRLCCLSRLSSCSRGLQTCCCIFNVVASSQ